MQREPAALQQHTCWCAGWWGLIHTIGRNERRLRFLVIEASW